MSSLAHTGRIAAALTVVGLASGCAASAAVPTPAAPARSAAVAPLAPVDRLTDIARRRYAIEVHGGVAIGTADRVAHDPMLLRTLQSGNVAATRAYVRRQFPAVWYHWHVSRMRIRQGSRLVVETGVPFAMAPWETPLRGARGRTLGTLEVSVQDVIGFVRFMHRNYPVDVVVRGQVAAHVRSSLPAATHATLPSRGRAKIGGHAYAVGSFKQTAWGGEPVTVWILAKA
jgi:hypothetical protein